MFRNYLKVALRSLWKNKELSVLNIGGLAIGLTCSLMIFVFVKDELSYDRHHKDAANIYRVVKDFVNDDGPKYPTPQRSRLWRRQCGANFRKSWRLPGCIRVGVVPGW